MDTRRRLDKRRRKKQGWETFWVGRSGWPISDRTVFRVVCALWNIRFFLADFAEDKLTFLQLFNLFLTNSFSVTVKLTISIMSKVTCKTEVWATSNL